MNKIENFGETENVAVTVLVDNTTDMLLKSTETVKRYKQESGGALLAEHGLSVLIELKDAGVRILWDAGMTTITLMENIRRMKIDPTTIDKIALSHGHLDHMKSMTEIIKAICEPPKPRKWGQEATPEDIREGVAGRKVPLIAHPAAFRERWKAFQDGSKYGPMRAPRDEWEAAGAEIIYSEGPYQLGPGCWTTGGVPRLSFETSGTSPFFAYREGDEFIRDYIEDDQAIIINVKDKGLVIVAGCAHSGILNTVDYAQKISGVDQVWAMMGGFHLAPYSDEDVQRTVAEIKKLKPEMIAPSHCTGFRAISRFANQMPDEFVVGAVGTTYLF
jgi:7,8-dihydropterin-6-yl-methyl-4-(beta-D-ribofuranosyl)aminobenzene 5'-phosphate synthase